MFMKTLTMGGEEREGGDGRILFEEEPPGPHQDEEKGDKNRG